MAALFENGWDEIIGLYAAGRAAETFRPTYIGLALLAVLLVVALIKAYRVWEEIHDVEEPSSPDDLLESFEQAHRAGELDDAELERVRARLASPPVGQSRIGEPCPRESTCRGSARPPRALRSTRARQPGPARPAQTAFRTASSRPVERTVRQPRRLVVASEVPLRRSEDRAGLIPILDSRMNATNSSDFGNGAQVVLDPIERGALRASFPEEDPEGLAKGVDGLRAHAGASQSDDIQSGDAVLSLLQDERRDVLGG